MSGYRFDRLRILVGDENPHMRKLTTTILRAFGIPNIHEASSGMAAWKLLHEVAPDIVMVDWALEGMTGVELTRQIRTSPASPNPFVPVIVLSSYTRLDHVHQARDAGANEFLAKPVTAIGMMARLVAVIEHPRPFVRTRSYFGPCRRRRENGKYQGPERRAQPLSQDEAKDFEAVA